MEVNLQGPVNRWFSDVDKKTGFNYNVRVVKMTCTCVKWKVTSM